MCLCVFGQDMEATYAEYEEWSEEPVPEVVIKNYKKALQQMAKYKPYEEALVSSSSANLNANVKCFSE